ncbi:STAS domain-containing protein [Nocardia asteroides]|uniref:STAS domain-containing protein n=1 Tax=Nocardia asteroides TaxID=1824 RepID=UPI0037B156B4
MSSPQDHLRPAAVEAGCRVGAVVEQRDSALVLHAWGEVDAYTFARWRDLLDTAASAAGGHLVLDLGQVTFLSARAVVDLAELADTLRRDDITLHLANPHPCCTIERILTAIGMGARLPIHRDLTAALAAATAYRADA